MALQPLWPSQKPYSVRSIGFVIYEDLKRAPCDQDCGSSFVGSSNIEPGGKKPYSVVCWVSSSGSSKLAVCFISHHSPVYCLMEVEYGSSTTCNIERCYQ